MFVMILAPEQTQRVFVILGLERLKFLVTMTDQLITVSLYSSALIYPVIQCRSRRRGGGGGGGCTPVFYPKSKNRHSENVEKKLSLDNFPQNNLYLLTFFRHSEMLVNSY